MPSAYEPLSARRKAAIVVLGAIIALHVGAAVSDLLELQLVDRARSGGGVTEAEGDASDRRQALIGALQLVSIIVGAVFFIRWLHGAYRNADALDPGARRYGTGWAIGGWFVPIMNLFRPKQIVNDVWAASTPAGHPARDREPGVLLLGWWLTWLASNIVDRIATSMAGSAETLDELRSSSIAFLVSDLFTLVPASLAILVIDRVTKRMESKAAAKAQADVELAAAAAAAAAAQQAADGQSAMVAAEAAADEPGERHPESADEPGGGWSPPRPPR